MNEFELIAALTSDSPGNDSVLIGAGDDCAVLDSGDPEKAWLFKTDATVGGVHFTGEADPRAVGRKALARVLSDVAAMGGAPMAAVITVGLPEEFDLNFLKKLYEGIHEMARRYGVAIVGGETTRNPERLFISIAALGTVNRTRMIPRSGAKAGDAIFVTGELGGSLDGRHLEFEPRLAEAGWLTKEFEVRSMIDISDGLAGDLRHILTASGVGAELLSRAIPISRAARTRFRNKLSPKPPLVAALTDGEDFELLFTVAPGDAVALLDGWKKAFPEVKLSCIGKITVEPGLRLRDEDRVQELKEKAYDHFAKS